MTPFFKTGTRKYQIHYSILVNGERHEKNTTIPSQSEAHAEKTLESMMSAEVELQIHSTTRVS